ncbi:YceD family protein [Streptomyces zagrosensis]|uniref:YceD family protein n=1 Tax=Streptomyces zagrosensis TaxID=1042984 RepID=UPI00161F7DC5
MNARLDHRSPLVFDTRELGRRPGALKRLTRSIDAPVDLGIEMIGVRKGAAVELDLRLESVMEGVLVTGTARAPLTGECVRCLEPLRRELAADFQEMYSYSDADDRSRVADTGDDAEEEDTLFLEDDLFDLEPVLRDAVVLALPLQPVCREDCPGLCPECGARLADDPDHHHQEAVDIRWAALQGLAETVQDGEKDNAPRDSGDDPQEK